MREQAIINQTPDRTKLQWNTILFISLFHIGSIVALFFFTWQALAVSVVLWWVAGSIGVGMGYHRLFTHRGYKTPKWLEYTMALCGTLAFEGGPINWVATHRIHHAHTDAPGDPHSPRDGKIWSHIGWIFVGTAQQHDEATLRRYAPDLFKDPVHVFINRFYWVPMVALGVGLYMFGGWSCLLWGIFLRSTVALHATWLVNSATHMWGSRRFDSRDDSTNNWWVALLTWGEGWHNNHHAHPRSARHGLRWYEFDPNWYAISALKYLGLATDIKVARADEKVHQTPNDELRRPLSQAA
ncbi:MAG TPA: fatty acid desaturase [Pyrinomonadaceae bacterium]|jgi:stearoyl-CoA desaturase (delta-9 desaturase)|nr:fatty acid desaturase [Pyrinomonadaceae bacterium]